MRLHHPKIGTLMLSFFPKGGTSHNGARALKRGSGPNWRAFVCWRFRLLIVWPSPGWISK
jgi:hypothetical protein